MRKVMICLLAAVTLASAQAQDEPLKKKEKKQLAAMIKDGQARAALPDLLQDDKKCLDWVMDLSHKTPDELGEAWAMACERQIQNDYIKKHIGSAIKDSILIQHTLNDINREAMRFSYFRMEYDEFLSNQEAQRRTMPKGQVVSLSYRRNGRVDNPYSPFEVRKEGSDAVVLTYGKHNNAIHYDLPLLDSLTNIIERERLYQLHSNYQVRGCPLPDATIHADFFDGDRWALTVNFDDGSVISSSGIYLPSLQVSALEKFLSNMVKVATSDRGEEDER